MTKKDDKPWATRSQHFTDFGGGGNRWVRKKKSGNYTIGVCPSCHARRAVSILAWSRASRPLCMACGQFLEPSGGAQVNNPELSTKGTEIVESFCVFCGCRLNRHHIGYCSSSICEQLDKITEDIAGSDGIRSVLVHTIKLDTSSDKAVWWEGTIRISRHSDCQRFLVKIDRTNDKWGYVDGDYLAQVRNAPLLKSGDKPTLANYLKLALSVFGEKSKAVAYLDKRITESMFGGDEIIRIEENTMLAKLGKIHFGKKET